MYQNHTPSTGSERRSGHRVAVVVPAYNEEKLIGRVIETMPEYVDHIVVVDDCSKDDTIRAVNQYLPKMSDCLHLIRHETNQGVGGAIATGYKWCRDHGIDAAAVMAGDAQMDPGDLPALLEPVINGEVDYAKGNRLFTGDAWQQIPRVRYLGNSGMSLLTKIASGYWHVADHQCGYGEISRRSTRWPGCRAPSRACSRSSSLCGSIWSTIKNCNEECLWVLGELP